MYSQDVDGFRSAFEIGSVCSLDKSTLEILQYTRVTSVPEGIEFVSSSIERTIILLAKNLRPTGMFDICTPTELTEKVLKLLDSGTVGMTVKKDLLEIDSGKSKAKIKLLSAVEFPSRPRYNSESPVTVKWDDFFRAVDRVGVASQKQKKNVDANYILAGVHLVVNDDRMTVTSADGFRVGTDSINVYNKSGIKIDVIVPADFLNKISGRVSGYVDVYATNGKLIIISDSDEYRIEYATQLIEGNYPDISQFLTFSGYRRVVVTSGDLKSALRRVMVFQEGLEIKPTLIGINGSVVKMAYKSETGQTVVEEVDNYQSELEEKFFMVLSSVYLYDAVGTMNGDIVIGIRNASYPVYIKAENKETLFVIMPIVSEVDEEVKMLVS